MDRIRSDLLCILRWSPTPMPTAIVRRRKAVPSEQVRIKAKNPMFPGNHLTMWHAGFRIAMLTLFGEVSFTAYRDSRLTIWDKRPVRFADCPSEWNPVRNRYRPRKSTFSFKIVLSNLSNVLILFQLRIFYTSKFLYICFFTLFNNLFTSKT